MGGTREGGPEGLPFPLADYLELVSWTGRAVCGGKRGTTAEDLAPILEPIGITRAAWLQLAKDFQTHFCHWIGQAVYVERVCEQGDSAGQAASAPAGGCFPAERPWLSP